VKDISRTTEIFREFTGMEIKQSAAPSDIINRIFNTLTCITVSKDSSRIRMKIVARCKILEANAELLGKTPKGIVSAVLYRELTELGFQINRAEIAAVCGVSVPTLVKIENILKIAA
jgi:transcription initiation factor TFIIIB Brf1 subunit/transcription initiation factor TFIIB